MPAHQPTQLALLLRRAQAPSSLDTRRIWRSILVGLPLILGASTASGVLPLPPYPDCGKDESLLTCPPDITRGDGSYKGSTWEYLSFIPPEVQAKVRPEELKAGSGNGIDRAWRYSTGRFDVTIAVLDSGVLWQESELRNKFRINAGELPRPLKQDGTPCATDDCNGDGLFNIQDFVNDPRVGPSTGIDASDGLLEPSDLIAAFSDGIDDDQNGYVDDIAGWDFLWDDNQPFATNGFDHGTGVMGDVGAEGGESNSDIGICPSCSVLPIRTGDSFMADADRLAQGILYATDLGVKVIAMASGTINNTSSLHDALEYAWSKGVTVVAAIGDELSYHHLYPGAADYLLAVHSIRYYPLSDWNKARTYQQFNGCNNYGTHLTVVAGTTSCATGATGITAGTAGLLYSYYRSLGVELHPDEVRAMIISTATDINVPTSGGTGPTFPSREGWDLFFGHGRVNAGAAIAYGVPPRAHLVGPRWYEYVDAATVSTIEIRGELSAPRAQFYDWKLEWAPGGDAPDRSFSLLTSGSGSAAQSGVLFRWPVASIPRDKLDPAAPVEQVFGEDTVLEKFARSNAHTITLRLTATDDQGRRAEMRKAFFLKEDPELLTGFPRFLGASGQSSPILKDVDGDGIAELLVGTASGMVHIFSGTLGMELPGWPKQMPYARSTDPARADAHASAPAYESGVPLLRQGVLASVTAGDVNGDGTVEVVVSTMDGLTYLYDASGQLRAGFPVSRDSIGDADTDALTWYDPGYLSSPYLADLDLDGNLEIIQAGMDQKVYVWRHDGQPQPGFPVKLETSSSAENIKGRIVSSPEVADLNLDGFPDIVIGSNEYNPELYVPGFAYAISGQGKLDRSGPILPGWPAVVPGALNGLVPFIGEGVTATPVLGDFDGNGRVEISMSGTVSCPHLYDWNGRRGITYECEDIFWRDPGTDDHIAIAFVSNPHLADLNLDGRLELVAMLSGVSYAIVLGTSTWLDHQDHLVGVWDAETGDMWPGWPVVVDDLGMFIRPEAADVTGDGIPEILVSTGGYLVHAFDHDGIDAPGWPKLTGGMVSSALEAGDFDGDGTNEVFAMTHEGYLFAWNTPGFTQEQTREVEVVHDRSRPAGPRNPGPAHDTLHRRR